MREEDEWSLERCYYCGALSDSSDHVIPRKVLQMLKDFPEELEELTRRRRLIVSACRQCNSLLSSSLQIDPKSRKKELKARLRRKYSKYLRIPDWPDSELAQLGPNMRQMVISGLITPDHARERIGY